MKSLSALPAKKPASRKRVSQRAAGSSAVSPKAQSPEGQRWRRDEADRALIIELGVRLKSVREQRKLSLTQLSETSGIPAATLSRIENSKMSPTAGVLARVMVALDIDWNDLVGPKQLKPGEKLLSYSAPDGGDYSEVRGYTARVLHAHDSASTQPLIFDIQTRELSEIGLFGHPGEEFCYVLAGTLVFHAEGQPPRIMPTGSSVLFDSSIPHAYLTAGPGPTKILLVVTRRYGSHFPKVGGPIA